MAAFTKRSICLLIYRQTISRPVGRIPVFVDPKRPQGGKCRLQH